MHDVMSLDPTDNSQYQHYRPPAASPTEGDAAAAAVAGGGAEAAAPAPRQALLREWHRRGNPFRVLGEGHSGSSSADDGNNDEVRES